MQFYVDGFRGGDPDLKNAAPARRDYSPHAPLPEKVDVLIAGTGPNIRAIVGWVPTHLWP